MFNFLETAKLFFRIAHHFTSQQQCVSVSVTRLSLVGSISLSDSFLASV